MNRERQVVQAQIYEEAKAAIEPTAARRAVGHRTGLRTLAPGVVGIVASKLVEEYGRPTVLIGLEGGEGKARDGALPPSISIAPWRRVSNIWQGLVAMSMRLDPHRAQQVPPFRDSFNRVASEQLTTVDGAPLLEIDAEVRLDDIDDPLLDYMARLEPFGEGKPPASWHEGRRSLANPSWWGKSSNICA